MNHRRSTSRRPRGSRSERRGRRAKRAARALAAGAAIAAGTQAYGDPIRYDNPPAGHPDHFEWRGALGTETWLDITQPPVSQTGDIMGLTSIGQRETAWYGLVEQSQGSLELGVGGPYDYFLIDAPVCLEYPIPDVDTWDHWGFTYYSGWGSELPEGVACYLALRWDPADGLYYYGWVGVERDGAGLDAFAWGYDTERFPEPATLSMLAFGAALVGCGKGRRERSYGWINVGN